MNMKCPKCGGAAAHMENNDKYIVSAEMLHVISLANAADGELEMALCHMCCDCGFTFYISGDE